MTTPVSDAVAVMDRAGKVIATIIMNGGYFQHAQTAVKIAKGEFQ